MDEEEETEEGTSTRPEPNPVDSGKIDSNPNDQKEIDDWFNKHGSK